jgi:2-polyprenyl-3-methyl-5-hydroxy-6-metoxy-1,4-benzoquinol methylase
LEDQGEGHCVRIDPVSSHTEASTMICRGNLVAVLAPNLKLCYLRRASHPHNLRNPRTLLKKRGAFYSSYRATRAFLERFGATRALIGYLLELKNTLVDSSERNRAAVEAEFGAEVDPYGFSRDLEQFRFRRALEMLSETEQRGRFGRVLEVGCAEGMFTEMLAPYCQRLLAVDLSRIALDRARLRCSSLANVEFSEWDVRRDPLQGPFDLIVATGVLEYIQRPATLRAVRKKLTEALRSGGYLLLGNTVTTDRIEDSWVGKILIRGTVINDFFAHNGQFETIASSLDQCICPFAHVLLRKVEL